MSFNKILCCPMCGYKLCQETADQNAVLDNSRFFCPDKCGKPCPPPMDKVCPDSGICNKAYAQYSIYSNRSSDSLLPFRLLEESGGLVSLTEDDGLVFTKGYIYYVSYTMLATPGDGNYYQILPILNGSPKLYYATFTPANQRRSASVSSGFLLPEAKTEDAVLRLRLVYPNEVNNIDLSGILSVFPVAVV